MAASPDVLKQSPFTIPQLTASIHDLTFILHVTVAACNGRIESNELRNLPDVLQVGVTEGVPCSRGTQQKALDVLLWMGLVHSTSGESGGYALLSNAVGLLMVSLMHSCFVEGDRLLSHKCSQLLFMLYR